ncbi:Hpt domain-containing protein [Pseudoduganella sp. RAF19]|uniref:hybrid sensor histidine kinase/response regulator n=3 Tax=unclassified Pseudoduganella TaxID=2637179 RepID=UPI003F9D9050
MSQTDFPFAASPHFDTGPLSWVMVEIREALARSRTALFEAGGRDPEDQSTALQHAKSHLHQAHGALQMVDVDGVVLLTQLAEVVLDRFKDGSLKCTPDHAQVLANLYQALVEFLEELLSGAPFQPVRLFPYFRDVQDLLGIDRVHPADLFFPDLTHVPELPAPLLGAAPTTEASPKAYTALRQRFERALLPYLKAGDSATQSIQAAALQAAVTDVADLQSEPKARVFWRSMQAFSELVVGGQLESGKYVKQLFGLINLQLRRLSQGAPEQPDAMLREALFFIAGADAGSLPPLARQLRAAYLLDGMVPHDFEQRRYGKIDPDALTAAREGIARARSTWQRMEQSEVNPDLDAEFRDSLNEVAQASDKLGLEALSGLMRQLSDTAARVSKGRSEALGLEMATALLFAEHGIDQIRHLPDDFNVHADTIGARLKAMEAGGDAPEPAQWQGSLARQMHENDTVVALSMELKAGLRQIEKVLDEYYTDPSKRSELASLDKVVHQLEGALAILDQDDATRAAKHVRSEIQKLAAGLDDPAHEPRHLDEIAQNVGALGFFVDMLAQNPEGARERFAFDAEQGTFRAVPFKKIAGPESIPVLDEPLPAPEPVPEAVVAAPPAASEGVSGEEAVEAELLEIFIGEAQEVLAFVRETLARPRSEAGTLDNMTMLRRSFHTLKGSGRMVGLNNFAEGAYGIEKVMNLWLAEERPLSDTLFALLDRASTDMSAWVDELAASGRSSRSSDALVAAALRVQNGEAFSMDEAAAAAPAAPAPAAEAQASSSALTLADDAAANAPAVDADAAANVSVFDANPAVAPAVPVEPLAEAANSAPVAEDAATAAASADAAAPSADAAAEADAVAEAATADAGAAAGELSNDASDLVATEASTGAAAADAEDISLDFTSQAAPEESAADAPAAARPPARNGNVIEFPAATAPAAPAPSADDNVKFVGRLAIPLPLYNIYLAETDELVRKLTRDFGEWRHERRAVSPEALKASHTLTGTSATVGFKALRELAYALETTLQALQAPVPNLDDAQHDLFDFTIERVRQMLASFAAGEMPPDQPELITALQKLRDELSHPPADIDARLDSMFAATEATEVTEAAETIEAAPAPLPEAGHLEERLDALFTDTYHSLVANPPAAPERKAPVAKPDMATQDESIDDLFSAAFDDAFAPPLTQTAPKHEEPLHLVPSAPSEEAEIEAAESGALVESIEEPIAAAEAHTEVEAVDPVALHAQEDAAAAEESMEIDAIEATEVAFEANEAEATGEAGLHEAVNLDIAPPSEVQVLPIPASEHLLAGSAASFTDELDPDLLPVFLEEGADLLPQVGEALRAWHNTPSDFSHAHSLQRVLHTVKGSARMAGAMRLGQHAHEIETHIENMVHANSATPHAFDELLAHYDHALLLFEQLQNPAAYQQAVQAAQAAPLASAAAEDSGVLADGAAATPSGAPAAGSAAAAGQAAAPRAPLPAPVQRGEEAEAGGSKSPLVRVRADILDRLVNQAGEVSIARSRLENEVNTLRTSLSDFQENLARLRRQLREVEMQAESQIASRMSIAGEREFDPLEFDRFTRLQELTRMMAESVNDVASFHEGLMRSVDTANGDLNQQARMTRDLQQDLMRVRMVPFASISERLFRVARQSAKEVDKRVNLDIRGSAVEMDRSVLERMAAPFEHLLRNAIVHGVEPRAKRGANGKAETGELLVQVSQQGNEVVLEFSDDGAGLDLDRIRAKARSVGLLADNEDVSDAEAVKLIFQPGFSTADTLTELAGRGVGMDVVQSEAQSLGGRVETFSELGKGTRFTIRLPLTLAVTQVVLVSAGGRTHALPAQMVEQVLQLKEAALQDATAKGAVVLHGQHVGLRYLPGLLGDHAAQPVQQRSSPVLMLHSGGGRIAVHVDEIVGNREVVIKNIGPQLSRMAGIAGATVLGSGEIVLILNPVALQQHIDENPELTAMMKPAAKAAPVAAAPQAATATIMVVDDSLTVRKVTQRLLEREGYRVMLAKDGVDALEQMQDHHPDLMLVDIEMPRMDGFDLTRNVRGDDRSKNIPIIMITSRTADKHRNYAMQLGVNAYFGKPFQDTILLGAIAGLLPTGS